MLETFSLLDPDVTIKAKAIDRSCNGCTKCCDGWLTCTIYGNRVDQYSPCKFKIKGEGCGIYPNRPYNPCHTFKCFWKTNNSIPDKFKPSKSNVIMIERVYEGLKFLDVVRAGDEMDTEVIDYTIQLFKDKKVENIRYLLPDNTVKYLSENQKFIDYVNGVDIRETRD